VPGFSPASFFPGCDASWTRVQNIEETMLKIGDKAPAFRLKNDAGNDVSLSDFAGKRLVLFFYPKANTPG
jgi:peroxiredoxin